MIELILSHQRGAILRSDKALTLFSINRPIMMLPERDTLKLAEFLNRNVIEDPDELIAPCGHLDRFWKVEVNQDAWCTLCAAEYFGIQLTKSLEEIDRLNAALKNIVDGTIPDDLSPVDYSRIIINGSQP